MNSSGKMIKEAGPSIPVQVAGFSELPIAGEEFEVVSQEKYSALKSVKITSSGALPRQIFSGEAFNLIVKTDASSSKEALLESLSKIAEKITSKKINIIYSGIGNITESDITLATDTGSEVIGLHVKVETNAAVVAQRNMISIRLYDIIYKLLEDIEKQVKEPEKVKLVSKKVGEAIVRKIFDIKNIGIIAGCYLKEGRFPREGRIVVWRGKKRIGEGSVKELERDRKPVKEVHAGFEFAFLAHGFDQWEIDDRIECFLDVPEK